MKTNEHANEPNKKPEEEDFEIVPILVCPGGPPLLNADGVTPIVMRVKREPKP